MLWFYTKLKHFDDEDRTFLVITVTQEAFDTLSAPEKASMRHLFSFINADTTVSSLKSVVDYCKEVFIEGKGPFIFVINEGENGEIIETKDAESDYTGKILTVRENSADTLIGFIAGNDSATQNIPYTAFPLAKNGIYRLRVQLETPTDEDEPSGDGTLLLSTAYVIVPLKIDVTPAS